MDKSLKEKLILLIRSALTKEVIPAGFSVNQSETLELYKLAKKHNIANIIYYALVSHDLCDKDGQGLKDFEQEYLKSIRTCTRQDACLLDIEKLYETEAVDFIPLKGSEIRNFYPERWMRTCNDIDVLVRTDDYDKACNMLVEKLNYNLEGVCGYHKGFETDNKVKIEIHNKINDEYIYDFDVKELTQDTWKIAENTQKSSDAGLSAHRFKLRHDYFYLYNVLHMLKHFKDGGCGIRFYIDLWILNNKKFYEINDEEQKARDTLLERYGVKVFERKSLDLAKMWFEGEDHPELASIEKFVFSVGTFGTLEARVKLGSGKKGGKTGYFISRIFVSRDYLKLLYPEVEKRPYLTPIYEVRRWGHIIFKNDSNATAEIKLSRENSSKGSLELSNEEMRAIKDTLGL